MLRKCNSHRIVLSTKVNAILLNNDINRVLTTEIYIYGHGSVPDNDNRDVLLATIEFIVKSNRFSN